MHTSRKRALQAVEPFYQTGKPCKHGHIAKRLTISGGCYECITIASKTQMAQTKHIRKLFAEKLREKQLRTRRSSSSLSLNSGS